jgi:hypothetical protein
MRTLLHSTLPALVFTLVLLALPAQSLAGDTSNASQITDPTIWAQYVHQVMGGTSKAGLPGAGSIRGPAGIYAVVRLTDRIPEAIKIAGMGTLAPCESVPKAVDDALTTYFNYLLGGGAPALPLSGLMILAQWQDLSECDPGTNLESLNPGSLRFNYLDDAFKAIEAWNKANPLSTPKTLQLVVTPGFNSPEWVTGEMMSCDDLFVHPVTSPPAGALTNCDYTEIFYRVENAPRIHLLLPLPWSQSYKDKWRFFLTALNNHIGARQEFVSIAVAGPTASSAEIILPNGDPLPHNLNAGAEALKLPGMKKGISVYTAWNCLLGNFYGLSGTCDNSGYGAGSSYVNTNRAFVEEWGGRDRYVRPDIQGRDARRDDRKRASRVSEPQ